MPRLNQRLNVTYLIFLSFAFYGWYSDKAEFFFVCLGLIFLHTIWTLQVDSRLQKIEENLEILRFKLLEEPKLKDYVRE